MKEIVLTAHPRETQGKGAARKIRQGGNIPGILYGPEVKPLNISLNGADLATLIRHEKRTNMLIDLNLGEEKKPRKVIIRELQRDPITGVFEHVDFYQVSMKKKINLAVRVQLVGLASGVKNSGGIMEHVTREIEIACLPTDIPEKVEVDISALEIGDSVHVRDLKIEKVEILTDLDQTVATVVPPTIIKVEVPVAAVPAEGEAVEGEAAEGEAKAEGAEGAEGKKPGEAAGKKPAEAGAKKPGDAKAASEPAKEKKEKK